MRILLILLSLLASPAFALDFPLRAEKVTITYFQSGNSGRQADVYKLENSRYRIEFQCGRQDVFAARARKTLNCTLRIVDRRLQEVLFVGINDFYQAGIEKFFRGLKAGDVLDSFYFGSLKFPKSLMIFHSGEIRVFEAAAHEKDLFEPVQEPENNSFR